MSTQYAGSGPISLEQVVDITSNASTPPLATTISFTNGTWTSTIEDDSTAFIREKRSNQNTIYPTTDTTFQFTSSVATHVSTIMTPSSTSSCM